MKYATIAEAAKELTDLGYKVSRSTLRRGIEDGRYPYLRITDRFLLDLDVIEPILQKSTQDSIGIKEVCERTGLCDSAVRRAIHDGWMPWWKEGNAYRFDFSQVQAALTERLQGGHAER